MAFTRADIPDLSGKTALITGANGGLGLETAKAFAACGARVIMAVRDRTKADRAMEEIRRDTPGANLELISLDLASLNSVRAAAEAILGTADRIDILVNNAGLMAMPERQTEDGFEMQWGVNHLGHWALTAHLMPALVAAQTARVVTVTSIARHQGRPIDPGNPHLRRGAYDPWKAYAQAKLANYHFGLGLQREFIRTGVAAESLLAHPGLSNTDLQSTSQAAGAGGVIGRFFHSLATRTGMSPAQGALPQIRAATDPHARGGELYGPRFGTNGPAVRLPVLRRGAEDAIRTLWRVSERETGVALVIPAP